MVLVGIDISADELVVAVERDGESVSIRRFGNDAAGQWKLIRWLTKSTRSVRVCLDATGVYGLDLSLALHRTKGVEVMVAIFFADRQAMGGIGHAARPGVSAGPTQSGLG